MTLSRFALAGLILLAPVGLVETAAAAPMRWPVDVHGAPTIRGGFGDMRGVGYHYGVDIGVDDAHPALGAPHGMSQRVYAVRAGYANYTGRPRSCIHRRIRIGAILYLHVSPTVPVGRQIAVGDSIGWTCRGNWHVHISQAAHPHSHDGEWLNPLGPGGIFARYRDHLPPSVGPIAIVRPSIARVVVAPAYPLSATARYATVVAEVASDAVSGTIDVVARMASARPPGRLGRRDPWMLTRGLPYRARIVIRDARRHVVYRNVPFVADLLGAPGGGHLPTDPRSLFASGTQIPTAGANCRLTLHRGGRCTRGAYWIHMTSHDGRVGLDTHRLRNGRYRLLVEAWNVSGDHASARANFRVANDVTGGGQALWMSPGPLSVLLPGVFDED